MTTRITLTLILLFIGGLGTANAQDDPRIGLVMGYPTNIAVLWHVADRFAIRPEIDFQRSSVKIERTGGTVVVPDSDDSSHLIRPGVSLLFYLGPKEDLRTYVSPRFLWVASDPSEDDEASSYLASGSFGAQYRLGSRFGLFGELGIQWSRSTTRFAPSSITGTTTIRSNGVSTRSAIGVVLYF